MEKPKPMNHHQFGELFKTKQRGGTWDCYGTWGCSDISLQGDTEENARIEAYNYLLKNGLIISQEEDERRRNVLAAYASKAKPQRTSP